MSVRNRIAPALEPYLRLPPEASLILLTGTLGCSVNWLTARFVGNFLAPGPSTSAVNGARDDENIAVVLVSWMRDAAFWKGELRRTMGIDTTKLAETKRYTFIDCFTRLNPLAEMLQTIKTTLAITSSSNKPCVLVLDNPDVLLALGLASARQLGAFLLTVRSLAHSTILVCASDLPLLSAAATTQQQLATPLEAENAAFVTQQAHNARFVLGVRELETGAAKDVSGVLRVTRGGAAYDESEDEGGVENVKEMEALYLVQRDGQAKVFERGAAGLG